MTIGPLVPGSPTVVTPTSGGAIYTSITGAAVDGFVVADDTLQCLDVSLSIQEALRARIPGLATQTVRYGHMSLANYSPLWTKSDDPYSRLTYWFNDTCALSYGVPFDITDLLAPPCKISGYGVIYTGAPGHTGLPSGMGGTMPRIQLETTPRLNVIGVSGTPTELNYAWDTSSTIPAFEAPHFITSSLSPITVNSNNKYFINVFSETGGYQKTGATITGLYVVFTP